MDWFWADGYEFARQVLQRGIAGVYVIAFCSSIAQFPVLLGQRGLQPVPAFLKLAGDRAGPTLFRLRYSDRLMRAVAAVGATIALSLVVGLPQLAPSWAPMIAFLAIWFGYLSIVNVGQTFYGFGWESLLLECGFLAAFLGSADTSPPVITILLMRWLLFRIEFGAGMIKLRGDRVWRDLTAMFYHHETQPMPNPLSWLFHHLPLWAHRGEVLGNHFAQLIVPFFLFAPQPVASVAAGIILVTQAWLMLSGNFAWLNVLTMLLAFAAIWDPAAHLVVPAIPATIHGQPADGWFIIIVCCVGILMLVLSYWPVRNLLARRQLMNASFNRWHLCNAYGAFGSITRPRYEVVIEATTDASGGEDAHWLEYEFKGKPGALKRMPRQFAPYHLRLDWLMWFLALGSAQNARGPHTAATEQWFLVLLLRLLHADRATLRLFRSAPFGSARPRWVRARVYIYRFSSWKQLRAEGSWWTREAAGMLVPAVCLPDTEGP